MRTRKAGLRQYTDKIIAILFGVALVVIDTIRIFRVPITFDEPNYSPTDSYLNIMKDEFGSANNHILHSVCRKFLVEHLGYNNFAHRADSLLALCVFLVSSYLLCRLLFNNKTWALACFILLNTISPLIFDFWGLGRGYSLGLAFMTTSIYFLFTCYKNNKKAYLAAAFVCGVLTVYSNFSFINYYLTLCAVVILRNILFYKEIRSARSVAGDMVVLIVFTGVLYLMVAGPIGYVYKNGELAYLGSNGFMADTLGSLAYAGLFIPQDHVLTIKLVIWAGTLSVWCTTCGWLYIYFSKRRRSEIIDSDIQTGILLNLLLVVSVISIIAQHVLLGINYLIDRTALFYIILFTLQLAYTLYYLGRKLPIAGAGLMLIVFTAAGYNFSTKVNLSRTYLWWFNAADLDVLARMNAESKNKPGKIKVNAFWIFVPTLNYGIELYYKPRFDTIADHRDEAIKDTIYDFYYLGSSDKTDSIQPYYHKDTDFCGGAFTLYKKNN